MNATDLRKNARELAESTMRDLADKGVAAAVELIRERINWRWGTGAPLLALEAEHMVTMLTFVPGIRARRLRVSIWRRLWIRRAARAWAVDPVFAEQCKICKPTAIKSDAQ
jgi:hypothetical protein